MEVSGLQAENILLKEKNNRAIGWYILGVNIYCSSPFLSIWFIVWSYLYHKLLMCSMHLQTVILSMRQLHLN